MRSLVLVADDPMVVRSMRVALRYAPGCRVAATVDGRFSVRASVSELRPDVVLVHEMCQRRNTIARLREATDASPTATAVLLYDRMDHGLVDDAFASGAHAAISRRLHPADLGTRLAALMAGTIVPARRSLPAHVAEAQATTSA